MISDTGQEARRTEYGRRILTDYEGRYTHKDLNQDETLTEKLDLSLIFELYPGTYTVTLTRDVTVEGKQVQLETTIQVRYSLVGKPR